MEAIAKKRNIARKILISVIFGVAGFLLNFYGVNFLEFPNLKVTILFGLFFPMVIAQFWGWRFGLLSALAGGCQTMWWLWQSDGYGMLYSVPVFSLWIVWHGWWSDKRRKSGRKWYRSMYIVELEFRILAELGFLIIFRWLVSLNPPLWNESITNNTVTLEWLWFVARKHTITAYVILLLTDVFMHIRIIRHFFLPSDRKGNKNTTYIISAAILFGLSLWMLHSCFDYFAFYSGKYSFLEISFTKIPASSLLSRNLLLFTCIVIGLVLSRVYLQLNSRQKAYLESRERFFKLVEVSSDVIFTLEEDKISYLNKAVLRYFDKGFTLTGKRFSAIIEENYQEEFKSALDLCLDGNIPEAFELRLKRVKDKSLIFEIHMTAVKDISGKVIEILVILHDITNRKRAEQQLYQAEEDWRHSFNAMEDILLITDDNFNIEKINKKGLDLLDKDFQDIKGKKCFHLMQNMGKENKICPFRMIINQEKVLIKELFLEKFRKYFRVKCSPVYSQKGKVSKFIILFDDITEKKEAENKLQEYQKNLENLVEERTQTLEEKNAEMGRYLRLFEKREFRIKELRDQVKELKEKLVHKS